MTFLLAIALMLSTNIGSAMAQEEVVFEVSAYTNEVCCTGKYPSDRGYGITSSGTQARNGVIAAGSMYPFGTKIYLENMGIFIVEDRGGAIGNDKIDVWVEDVKTAISFGRRKIKGRVVE